MVERRVFSTYSIIAADENEIGAAVQTHQMCVGSIVPWLLPGIGAVATQSLVNVSLGPIGLAMLDEETPSDQVVEALAASDAEAHRRQFAVINSAGEAAAFTGSGCIPEAGHRIGDGYSVQANMMERPTVVDAMAHAYEHDDGPLADRMMAALKAAQAESGDIRGMQSASLAVVPNNQTVPSWRRALDLRVDEHDSPLAELERLLRFTKAQRIDDEGGRLLESGDIDGALERWRAARTLAPELEELGYWQAVTLADRHPARLADAVTILSEALAGETRPDRWHDLTQRLVTCGLLERAEVAAEIQSALDSDA